MSLSSLEFEQDDTEPNNLMLLANAQDLDCNTQAEILRQEKEFMLLEQKYNIYPYTIISPKPVNLPTEIMVQEEIKPASKPSKPRGRYNISPSVNILKSDLPNELIPKTKPASDRKTKLNRIKIFKCNICGDPDKSNHDCPYATVRISSLAENYNILSDDLKKLVDSQPEEAKQKRKDLKYKSYRKRKKAVLEN